MFNFDVYTINTNNVNLKEGRVVSILDQRTATPTLTVLWLWSNSKTKTTKVGAYPYKPNTTIGIVSYIQPQNLRNVL